MLLKSQAISVIFMNTFVTSSHIGLTRPVGETMMECVLEDCLVRTRHCSAGMAV